jgi:hypothetical protein
MTVRIVARRLWSRREAVGGVLRLQEEVPEGQILDSSARSKGWGHTTLSSSSLALYPAWCRPWDSRRSSPGLRARGSVPLVSTATRNPRACRASIRGASSCRSGSPPVQTTHKGETGACRWSRDGVGEGLGRGVLAAVLAVGGGEFGVAETAGRRGAVFFAAAPQVAPREAQEDSPRGPPVRLPPAAWQRSPERGSSCAGDPRGRSAAGGGRAGPAARKPARRRWQESHSRHGAPSGWGS